MKLHLAERDPQHHAWPKRGVEKAEMKLRILLSYWYYKDIDLDALFAKYFTPPYPDVFADSGAYSAMTQGANITCQEYATWVKKWQHLFSVYANLDVIGNGQKTWENQQTLETMGINPIPAFHVNTDFKWLEQYVNLYPYIALGVAGMQARKPQLMAWITKCFKIASSKSVFHGFALTSWEVMKSFRWYSVDSSSWGQGFRFGQVPVFDDKRGQFYKLKLGNYQDWNKHSKLVTRLGFNPIDFADRSKNDRAKICAISALSYMKAEQWLRQRHGEIRIPNQNNAPEVLRAHLADANPARFGEITKGLNEQPNVTESRLHLADTSNGINYGDADRGIKLHLADARGHSAADLSAAETGLKSYLGATAPGQQAEWRSRSATDNGLKLHLVDSNYPPGRDRGHVQSGLKIHLSEHSLDRGGG